MVFLNKGFVSMYLDVWIISQPCKAAGFGEISNWNSCSFFFFLKIRLPCKASKCFSDEQSQASLRKSSGSYDQGQTGSYWKLVNHGRHSMDATLTAVLLLQDIIIKRWAWRAFIDSLLVLASVYLNTRRHLSLWNSDLCNEVWPHTPHVF